MGRLARLSLLSDVACVGREVDTWTQARRWRDVTTLGSPDGLEAYAETANFYAHFCSPPPTGGGHEFASPSQGCGGDSSFSEEKWRVA